MNTKENHVAFIMWIIIILVVVAAVILILTSNANLFSNENNNQSEQAKNLNDNNVKIALEQLKTNCLTLRVLGNYCHA